MPRSSSAPLSLSKLSTLTLFLLLSSFLLPSNAFAQGSKRKSLYDPIEENDKDRPDKRAEWLMRGRVAPKGQSAAALRLRAHQQKMAMRAARQAVAAKAGRSTTSATATAGWVPLGPAPLVSDQSFYGDVSGRVTAIAVDPSDTTGNTVYAAGASGGVWKSTNAAGTLANVTWTPVTDQQASLTNGAVSVKSDGSVVLVGTGEPDNAIDSYYGVGILRSTDGGGTWTLIQSDSGARPFAGMGFSKFAWSTASTNTVVAGGADAFKGDQEDLAGNTHGLYLSTDAGQTWAYQAPTDGSAPVSATDVVYNATAGKFFAALRYHGVYSSTNGTSWTRLANQPNPLSLTNCPTAATSSCPMDRGQFAVVPGRNEMYFWFINANLQDQGIWQSLDGGSTWKQLQPASQCTLDPDSFNPPCGMLQPFYNLELGAIPNGTGTDLYAGLVNLYKCRVNSGTQSCATIDSNLPNKWINLTQVYTCSTISLVHPDEHGFGFEIVGGKAITYFGNDGGVYRTLDALTELNSGTCGVANTFENLNATIGSMTQFVSFSVHPTDQNTLLGGTQDNGSPATSTATTSSQFITVLGGDGGYNAINPTSVSEWFASNAGSIIAICELGTSCDDNSFNLEAAPPNTIQGFPGNIDFGAFYTPYILDPLNPADMLIGTCRVWRGTTNPPDGPGTFASLSVNFDTLGATACNGSEINQVTDLAAGGAKGSDGLSDVVYAVTFGLGPLYGPSFGPAGEVWATTNAATTQLSNVTGSINPSNYAISSVSIDNSDASGNTAYVGIMGFNTSHVWKTTTAGASGWTDWTGSGLPDSPVNDLLVDSQAGKIYAGTDVGIFVSSTSSASWTEVGPAPGSGQAGYLPNVPVSAIRIFNSGGVKKLRVSTYGRGIWEYSLAATTPDFTLATSGSTSHTVLAGQTTQNYTFVVTAASPATTFASAVTFACSGLPDTTAACVTPTITAGASSPQTVTLTITTKGPNSGTGATIQRRADKRSPWIPSTLPLAGIVMLGIARRKLSKRSVIVGLCVSLVLLGFMVACGGSSTPPPPVAITVTPNTPVNLYFNEAGNAWPTAATQQQYTAAVTNSSNTTVSWQVNGVAGGNATFGIITSAGLYTAPATLPSPATFNVTAIAQADTTKTASDQVNIQTPTTLGTFTVNVTATESGVSHSQPVTLTVQ